MDLVMKNFQSKSIARWGGMGKRKRARDSKTGLGKVHLPESCQPVASQKVRLVSGGLIGGRPEAFRKVWTPKKGDPVKGLANPFFMSIITY